MCTFDRKKKEKESVLRNKRANYHASWLSPTIVGPGTTYTSSLAAILRLKSLGKTIVYKQLAFVLDHDGFLLQAVTSC